MNNNIPKYEDTLPQSEATPSYEDTLPQDEEVSNGLMQDFGDVAKGAGQGVTLGFGDEILGAGQAAYDVATDPDKSIGDIGSFYRQRQKENELAFEEAKERSPYLTLGGEMLGGSLLGGPLGLTGKGASMAANAGKLAKVGAVAGIGGSRGTIEDIGSEISDSKVPALVQDSAVGAGLGAAMGPIGSGIEKGLGKLGQVAADSPLLKKLGYTWDAVKNRGINFTGAKAGEDIRNTVNTTSNSVAKQFLDPLKQSSDMYGDVLETASKSGAKIGTDDDLMGALSRARKGILGNEDDVGKNAAGGQNIQTKLNPETLEQTPILKEEIERVFNPNTVSQDTIVNTSMVKAPGSPSISVPEEIIKGRGGLTPELKALLEKHGKSVYNPETVSQTMQQLTPREAKELQLGLRQLLSKGAYKDTEVVSDLEKALTPAIRKALPEGELNKINSVFEQARANVEPILNKGNIDPALQPKSVSDIDPEALQSKFNDYLKKLIKNSADSNDLGVESKGAVSDILSNAKRINEKNQIQFTNPDQMATQIEDAGLQHAVRKGIYGDKAQDSLAKPGIMDFITGSPYRAVEGAAKVARSAGNSKVAQAGKNLYATTDEHLNSIADTLSNNGMGYMGSALKTALENKSSSGKHAALFAIMQNPNSRKLLVPEGQEE